MREYGGGRQGYGDIDEYRGGRGGRGVRGWRGGRKDYGDRDEYRGGRGGRGGGGRGNEGVETTMKEILEIKNKIDLLLKCSRNWDIPGILCTQQRTSEHFLKTPNSK